MHAEHPPNLPETRSQNPVLNLIHPQPQPQTKRKGRKRKSKFRREGEVVIRWVANFMAIINLPASIPQIIDVWHGHIDGANPITWGYLCVVAIIWTLFGITTRNKSLILDRSMDLTARVTIFIGIMWWKYLRGE